MEKNVSIRALDPVTRDTDIIYSFGSLVTDRDEYDTMVAAFAEAGFGPDDCEFIYADNSHRNDFDAYTAYNRFLQEARGRYVVLCHQDILPMSADRATLDRRLSELTRLDGDWGLCGNAGGKATGDLAVLLTQGPDHVTIDYGGPFPQRVMSLDENFIVVRKDANLALSRDLHGFHWYGADLSVIADVLGWSAYVIDFHLYHKSTGNVGADFRLQAHAFRRKYSRAFRSRWHIVPTRMQEFLSGSAIRIFMARAANRIRRFV